MYRYVGNNPIRFNDPSGYAASCTSDPGLTQVHLSNGDIQIISGGEQLPNAVSIAVANTLINNNSNYLDQLIKDGTLTDNGQVHLEVERLTTPDNAASRFDAINQILGGDK